MSAADHDATCPEREVDSDNKCIKCGKVPIRKLTFTQTAKLVKDLKIDPEGVVKKWLNLAIDAMTPQGIVAAMNAKRDLVDIAIDNWHLDHWTVSWIARIVLRRFWHLVVYYTRADVYYHKLTRNGTIHGEFYNRKDVREYIIRQTNRTREYLYEFTWGKAQKAAVQQARAQ